MALIDKETIRAEIERRMTENCAIAEKADCFGQRAVEDNDLLAFLDTLPEQPASEEMFRNLLDAMGDCGFSQDNILLLKSIWEDAYDADKKAVKEIVKTVRKEVTRQVKEMVGKQPVEGLEKEIKRMVYDAVYDLDGPAIIGTSKYLSVEDVANIARHFYDLGCRHTAVMYDDIEYERQRAEEAEITKGLEEEISSYWSRVTGYQPKFAVLELTKDDLAKVARHFAEWGAEEGRRLALENMRA